VLLAPLVALTAQAPARGSTLPTGFTDSVVLGGLSNPTVVQFATDGRVFVGQKNGVIKVFQNLTDTSPDTFADLSTKVHDYWDRGLLGLALDPNFPANPYVYVLYAHDAPIGGTAPTWNDACPTPPGPTTDGCLVSGRLSRLQANATS
jgi:glucose/arabinose dehydrogenase